MTLSTENSQSYNSKYQHLILINISTSLYFHEKDTVMYLRRLASKYYDKHYPFITSQSTTHQQNTKKEENKIIRKNMSLIRQATNISLTTQAKYV